MGLRWKDRVVVVTGASAGVGRAIVRRFARGGARLGLLARDEERLRTTAAEVERLGGTALAIPTDVADPEQVEAAAAAVERELGEIDVWVNNAMVTVLGELHDLAVAQRTMARARGRRPHRGGVGAGVAGTSPVT